MLVLKVAVVLMAIACYSSIVDARCCGGCPLSGRCADRTGCRPLLHCCATRPCNFLCCNCRGRCRAPRTRAIDYLIGQAEIEPEDLNIALERFGQLDKDKNGEVDFAEFHEFMPLIDSSAFKDMDVNGDGKVTIEEFDEDAGRELKKI